MSLDMNELVRLVKRAAVEAVRVGAPMAECYGTVLSADPLKIQVDQKLILTETQLILTGMVRDFVIEVEVDHETESASHEHSVTGAAEAVEHGHEVVGTAADNGTVEEHGHEVAGSAEPVFHSHAVTGTALIASHSHRVRGRKRVVLHCGLTVGERVVMLRCDGGQKYVVLDRWEAKK